MIHKRLYHQSLNAQGELPPGLPSEYYRLHYQSKVDYLESRCRWLKHSREIEGPLFPIWALQNGLYASRLRAIRLAGEEFLRIQSNYNKVSW